MLFRSVWDGLDLYRLVILSSALKDLHTIPKTYRDLIRSRIAQLASDPRPQGCRKIQERIYRVRQAAYRIIYRVNDEGQVVTVLRVKHRREAYR